MPYLTLSEYLTYSSHTLEQAEFDKLESKASDVLNYITRNFYVYNDILADVDFRRDAFKKAVAAQIDYFVVRGATSSFELNQASSVQIGRTQMSTGANNQKQQNNNPLVSDDVYVLLAYTGLLYSGLGTLQC